MTVYKGVDYYDPNRPPDRRRRTNDGRRKVWNVSKIWDNHQEIIRRLVLGQKNVQIAEELGLTPMLVSNVKNSPIVQDQVAIMQGARNAYTVDIAREIREFAPKALEVLKKVVSGEGWDGPPISAALKAKVAGDLLDRAGHGAIRNINMQSVHAHLTKEDIEAIKQRALQTNAPVVMESANV